MEERQLLDVLTEDLARELVPALGPDVEVGRYRRYDDEEVESRALPIRVALISFSGVLEDTIFLFGALGEDVMAQAAGIVSGRIGVKAAEIGRSVTASEPELHTLSSSEEAIEQLEALLGERTISFQAPGGELVAVLGSGFVASACSALDPAATVATSAVDAGAASAADAAPEPPAAEAGASPEPESQDDAAAAAPAQAPATAPAATPAAAVAAAAPAPEADLSQFSVTDPEVAELLGITLASPQTSDRRMPGEMMHPTGSSPEEVAAIAAANAAALENWEDRLSGIEVEVSAELGSARLRLGDATSLVADSVLTLDELVTDPVTVYVNGVLFATANLVVVDDEYGIEIIEVLDRSAAESASAQLAA